MIQAVSPTATVERITGGAELTVHDLNGTTTATIYDGQTGQTGPQGPEGPAGKDGKDGSDGKDGQDGAPGQDGKDGEDGKDGANGKDGADGVSPTITSESITGGHRLTITDAQGETIVDVMDGVDGQDGSDGSPGVDGYSPTASVSKSGSVATISITDKNGTTTATVSDGMNGTNGQDGAPGVGVPSGGTDGQMLVKDGATDYLAKWVDQPGTGWKLINSGKTTEDVSAINITTDSGGNPFSLHEVMVHVYGKCSNANDVTLRLGVLNPENNSQYRSISLHATGLASTSQNKYCWIGAIAFPDHSTLPIRVPSATSGTTFNNLQLMNGCMTNSNNEGTYNGTIDSLRIYTLQYQTTITAGFEYEIYGR